jgi:FAD/FMN-containing dehydrogenase
MSSEFWFDLIYVLFTCVQIPIVPYGGATSIEGHTLAPHGGVCIDMTLMKVHIKQYNLNHIAVTKC